MIVLFHFSEGHHYSGLAPGLDLLAARGYLWVEFFFALSGFHPHPCLWRAPGRRCSRRHGYGAFHARRG